MNSLEIRETKMKLIDEVNKIQLPLEVKRMMLSEVMAELEKATNQEIDELFAERQKESESREEKKDE